MNMNLPPSEEIPASIYGDSPLVTDWVKSSFSAGVAACVELGAVQDGTRPGDLVAVRDSKDPDGPALLLERADVSDLLHAIQSGELDILYSDRGQPSSELPATETQAEQSDSTVGNSSCPD